MIPGRLRSIAEDLEKDYHGNLCNAAIELSVLTNLLKKDEIVRIVASNSACFKGHDHEEKLKRDLLKYFFES